MKTVRLIMKLFVYVLVSAAAEGVYTEAMGQQNSASSGAAQSDQIRPRLKVQLGHSGEVNYAIFSGDAKYVLTMSGSGAAFIDSEQRARLWDVESGKEVRSFGEPGDIVGFAVFSPDSKYVLTVSQDKVAQLYEIASDKVRKFTLAGHRNMVTSASLSANGKYLLTRSYFENSA